MIISITDYEQLFPTSNMLPYLKHVSDNSLRSGLIKWDTAESFMWASTFNGDFAAFKIQDFSIGKKLPTTLELDVKQYDNIRTSLSLWPSGTARKYFPNDVSKQPHHEYLEVVIDGGVYSSLNYDEDQLRQLICNATLQEINYYQNKLAEALNQKSARWAHETPTKEFPFRIYLYGTDDFSMSKLCSSLTDCETILEDVGKNPFFMTLRKYNFHFSN